MEVEGRVVAEGAGDVGAALAADEEDAVAIENDDEAGLDMIPERQCLIPRISLDYVVLGHLFYRSLEKKPSE